MGTAALRKTVPCIQLNNLRSEPRLSMVVYNRNSASSATGVAETTFGANSLEDIPVTFRYNFGAIQKGQLKVTSIYLRIRGNPLATPLCDPIHLFLGDIDFIEGDTPTSKSSNKSKLLDITIECKTFQNLQLIQVSADVAYRLRETVFFKQPPAFALFQLVPSLTSVRCPWDTSYYGESESEKEILEKAGWKVDSISNQSYTLCDTYPRSLVVPVKSTETLLKSASAHRTNQRIPVLSWIHYKNQAAICRSSQPRTGITNRKNEDDTDVLRNILTTAKVDDLPGNGKLTIFDARPRINAAVCHATGGGVENCESRYRYCGIENIHEVRKSHKKLRKLCMRSHKGKVSDPLAFKDAFIKTGWPKHLKTILKSAIKAAEFVQDGFAVLIHCSDGWDRTAQITSLMILLQDQEFRTIRGFMKLIEREWSSMGHRFSLRLGQGVCRDKDDDRAPIFLQFIECVWRLQQIFPSLMQFNEEFLITLLHHSYSCCFGNFLFDCERERIERNVYRKTFSVWDYLTSHETDFINPSYDTSPNAQELQLSALLTKLKELPLPFWKRWYLSPSLRNIDYLKASDWSEVNKALGLV